MWPISPQYLNLPFVRHVNVTRLPLSCQVVQRREPRDLRRRGSVVGHGEAAIVLELEPAGTLEVAGLILS